MSRGCNRGMYCPRRSYPSRWGTAVVIVGDVYKDVNGNGDHPGCVVDRGDNHVPRVLVDGGRSGGIIILRVSVHTALLVSLRVAYFVK